MTPEELAKAFATADAIHALLDAEEGFSVIPSSVNYLMLVAVGDGKWVATFNGVSEGDWYEKSQISQYPYSARSTNPADAVMDAANKLIDDLQLKLAV